MSASPDFDDASARFALLDMGTPELPRWAAAAIAAIAAIVPIPPEVAYAALEALVGPLRAQPEGPAKDAVREALATKQAEIRAAHHAARAAQGSAPVAAAPSPTQRQATPVTPAHGIPAYTAPEQAQATAQPRPVVGSWTKIRTGKHAGTWGVRLDGGFGDPFRAPVVGDVVLVHSKSRGTTQPKRVVQIVWSDGTAHVLAVEDAPDGARATLHRSDGASASNAPVEASIPESVHDALTAPVNSELAAEDNALAQDLAAAMGESAANAATNASGSLASGSMMGVGFSTAEGYVQALANGVKAATAEGYKSTLRTSYGYSDAQIAALTITIIPESVLPVGVGITHEPTGPSIFDKPKSERVFKVGESKSKRDVRAFLSERDFIAGAVAENSFVQVSWTGEGQTTCEAVNAALPSELASLAPNPPSAERHAGDAVASLRGRDYDTARLPSRDLPDGVNARWLVGRKLSGAAVKAGDAYGTALLVVSLHDDETISFDGDVTLAAQVRTTYTASTAKETLRSNTLTPWLSGLLRNRFRGVKRGHVWYVPSAFAGDATALVTAIQKLWGDHEVIPVTSGKQLMGSLTRGLRDEVSTLQKDYETKLAAARENAAKKARKECEEQNTERKRRGWNPANLHTSTAIDALADQAAQRATVGARTATSLLAKLAEVAARVDGYTAALGEESTAGLKAEIATLRAALEPIADDADLRAAMLELS